MKESKQVSARIGTDLIERYLESYKKYQKENFPDVPVRDLTMTRILEESLFYAAKFFEKSIEEEKK